MATEDVVARLRAEGEGAFTQAFGRARDAIVGTTQAGEESAGGLKGVGKNLIGAAAGAAVAKKGFSFMKGAADDASTLAKSTAGLARQTGMDTSAASAWVSMAKQRGIETKGLQTSFTAFSKQLQGAQTGSKTAADAMRTLGVDVEGLKKGTNDMQGALMQASETFADMPDGPEKTALAVKAFGRQGLALLPILNSGSEALEEQMTAMDKAGLTMDKSGVKKSLDLAKAQREMRSSMDGVKVQIGQALIPVMLKLAQTVLPVIQGFAELMNKSPVLATAVIALASAFAALIVLSKVIAIMQGVAAAFGVTATAATLLWVALGIGVVIAIIAGLVLLYTKVGWFRDAVDAAFTAIKTAVGAAVGGVIAAFDWLKGALSATVSFVSGKVGDIAGFFASLPGKVKSALTSLPSVIGNAFKDAAAAAWKQLTWLIDQIKKLPEIVAGFIGSLGSSVGDALKGAVKSVLPGPLADLLATGGIVAAQTGLTAGGGKNVLVGERGPEMLSLPSGSRVTPLPPPSLAGSQLGGGEQTVVAQVFLERRMIAEALASYTAERQASRG